jgi:integrase
VEAIPAPASGESFVWDDELAGFGVRIYPSKRRFYLVQYRANGRTRRVALGSHGVLTVDEARRRARGVLARVALGEDPAEAAAEERRASTVAELAERYLVEHAEVRKKPTSLRNDRLLLRTHILPRLGPVKIASVTRADVAALHHALRRTPTTANRAVALISKMFNLAERWGLRPDGSNPCRHVEKFREKARRRFLSRDEISRLGRALDESEGVESRSAVAALRLLLFTGARVGEVLALKWEHVDFDLGSLRLPDSKTGAKEIPLGPEAMNVLASLDREHSPFVIAGRDGDAPLVNLNKSWRRIRERAGIPDARLHDLRRTAASAGASIGLSLEAVGQLLGHTQAATTKRYAFLFDDTKRDAAERLSARMAADLSGSPVVSLVEARRSRVAHSKTSSSS